MSEHHEIVRPPGAAGRRSPVRVVAAILVVAAIGAGLLLSRTDGTPPPAGAGGFPPAQVLVSRPLQRALVSRTGFLGQFSAVDTLEIRAQVGGTLTGIRFTDGQIVHQGDLLFEIDPRPYQIRLAQATAQVRSAEARLALTGSELWRAQQLKRTEFGTGQSVDQRQADQLAAQAALELAGAAVRDAQLDLDFCQVRAPFTGRIGEHQVSVGSLVSGSRAGTSATTLLATLVSLDPIHLDFDMSEADFLHYQAEHRVAAGQAANMAAGTASTATGTDAGTAPVAIKLADESSFGHHGTLDFVDNALDRSSGTIHARATVPNPDLRLIPGEFARVRLDGAAPHQALLVPADAVVPDQSQHMLMTVGSNNRVVPKIVELGGLRGGLQVVTAGLSPSDQVIIDGVVHAFPGAPVVPHPGAIRFDDAADGQD